MTTALSNAQGPQVAGVENDVQPPKGVGRSGRKEWLASVPKPKGRGWIHAITAPLALANSILLVIFAPDTAAKIACVIFGLSAVLLFGNSGLYHRGNWGAKVDGILRRIDHANIFLLIAGTYTPLSIMMLSPGRERLVLGIVWTGAIIGSLLHIFWINSPRWLYVPLYVALGWVAVWFLPDFWSAGNAAIVWLLIGGGIAYTVGALFYGMRWPNPWPRHFGFHEFFHVCTVLGYAAHSVAVWLTIFAVS